MLQPAIVRKIIKELGQLRTDPPEGIRVQVDEEDVLQFVGIIAGPGKSDPALHSIPSLR
jgi:ubiquitin-conjugating enzyme E2 S